MRKFSALPNGNRSMFLIFISSMQCLNSISPADFSAPHKQASKLSISLTMNRFTFLSGSSSPKKSILRIPSEINSGQVVRISLVTRLAKAKRSSFDDRANHTSGQVLLVAAPLRRPQLENALYWIVYPKRR